MNIYAILEGLAKIQSILPFSFTNVLERYLRIIINMLLNNNNNNNVNNIYKNEKLINCIITSNTKPLIIFSYYTN